MYVYALNASQHSLIDASCLLSGASPWKESETSCGDGLALALYLYLAPSCGPWSSSALASETGGAYGAGGGSSEENGTASVLESGISYEGNGTSYEGNGIFYEGNGTSYEGNGTSYEESGTFRGESGTCGACCHEENETCFSFCPWIEIVILSECLFLTLSCYLTHPLQEQQWHWRLPSEPP